MVSLGRNSKKKINKKKYANRQFMRLFVKRVCKTGIESIQFVQQKSALLWLNLCVNNHKYQLLWGEFCEKTLPLSRIKLIIRTIFSSQNILFSWDPLFFNKGNCCDAPKTSHSWVRILFWWHLRPIFLPKTKSDSP